MDKLHERTSRGAGACADISTTAVTHAASSPNHAVQLNPDEDSLKRMRLLRGEDVDPEAGVSTAAAAADGAADAAAEPAAQATARSQPASTSAAAEEPEEGTHPRSCPLEVQGLYSCSLHPACSTGQSGTDTHHASSTASLHLAANHRSECQDCRVMHWAYTLGVVLPPAAPPMRFSAPMVPAQNVQGHVSQAPFLQLASC